MYRIGGAAWSEAGSRFQGRNAVAVTVAAVNVAALRISMVSSLELVCDRASTTSAMSVPPIRGPTCRNSDSRLKGRAPEDEVIPVVGAASRLWRASNIV